MLLGKNSEVALGLQSLQVLSASRATGTAKGEAPVAEPLLFQILEERIEELHVKDERWTSLLGSWILSSGCTQYVHVLRAGPRRLTLALSTSPCQPTFAPASLGPSMCFGLELQQATYSHSSIYKKPSKASSTTSIPDAIRRNISGEAYMAVTMKDGTRLNWACGAFSHGGAACNATKQRLKTRGNLLREHSLPQVARALMADLMVGPGAELHCMRVAKWQCITLDWCSGLFNQESSS
eukprot:s2041_g3.t1